MPAAETPGAVSLRNWTNQAPKEPASQESPNGSERLLRTFLEHQQELDLDSTQIAELSRLYWSRPLPAVAETIAAIEQRLSPEQFRKSFGYIAAGQANGSATFTPPNVDALVKAAVDERLKDKDVVTVDLAAKAAERLMTWTKLFGIPVAVFLAFLSFWGVSSVQEARGLKEKAEAYLQTTARDLDSVRAQSMEAKRQLAEVQQAQAQNKIAIDRLNTAVQDLQQKLSQSVSGFLAYFQNLGYAPKGSAITISTNANEGNLLSYFDTTNNTIAVRPDLAEDETLILHEYAHKVLYSSLSFDLFGGNSKSRYSALPIEGGLANYFVGSFRDQPVIGAVAAQRLGSEAKGVLPVNLENAERITRTDLVDTDMPLINQLQLAWGGAFWELRQKLGQDAVDKSLYRAWRALTDRDHHLVARSFIANVAAQLKSAAGEPATKILRDVLARRGISNADLPGAG